MMYVLRYALCGGRGLYDVTVTCRTGGYYDNNDVGGVLFFLLCYMCVFSFVGLQYGDWYNAR